MHIFTSRDGYCKRPDYVSIFGQRVSRLIDAPVTRIHPSRSLSEAIYAVS